MPIMMPCPGRACGAAAAGDPGCGLCRGAGEVDARALPLDHLRDLAAGSSSVDQSQLLTLPELFMAQADLQAALGWSTDRGEPGVRLNLLAVVNEAMEALDEVNWKPWKKTLKPVDRTALATELTDLLQFWVNACLAAGLGPADVTAALRAKWKVNHQRLKGGY